MQWTEKYRPKCLNDIVGQDEAIKAIRGYMNNGGLPNLLFHGPPGTGKTTLAHAIVSEVLGVASSQNFTEINGSDDRTNFIWNLCVNAVRYMPFDPSKPKIILIDEADGLCPSTQEAIRKPIENRGRTVFIFTANNYKEFNEAVISRMTEFKLGPLANDVIELRLKRILKTEKKRLPKGLCREIAVAANGDIRHAINELQKAAMMI